MKDNSDIELLKRIRNRNKSRPKTESEKGYFAIRKMNQEEVLKRHKLAQEKFLPKPTWQSSLTQTIEG